MNELGAIGSGVVARRSAIGRRKVSVRSLLVWLRKVVWNAISFQAEVRIRARVQPGYRKSHMRRARKARLSAERAASKPHSGPISLVIVCNMPSAWNTFESIFREAVVAEDIAVSIVTLPQKVASGYLDYSDEVYGRNEAFAYCSSFFPDSINAFDERSRTWFDVAELNPDYILMNRPYDGEVPVMYGSDRLSQLAKVCYVPYSHCKMQWDSRFVYRLDFIDNAYAVFTESVRYRNMLRQIYRDVFGEPAKIIECVGYPRFDLLDDAEGPAPSCTTVLWLPRWATDDWFEPSSFFRYAEAIMSFCGHRTDLKLICRPHPRMFENFVLAGAMTSAQVDEFRSAFAANGFQLDESANYLDSLLQADIFISDATSLLVEEFALGKPIVYCGSTRHFDEDAKGWAGLMYHVSDEDELVDRMASLVDGHDPLRRERVGKARELLAGNNAGARILDFVRMDYQLA